MRLDHYTCLLIFFYLHHRRDRRQRIGSATQATAGQWDAPASSLVRRRRGSGMRRPALPSGYGRAAGCTGQLFHLETARRRDAPNRSSIRRQWGIEAISADSNPGEAVDAFIDSALHGVRRCVTGSAYEGAFGVGDQATKTRSCKKVLHWLNELGITFVRF
jgi:hypothetical protein